MAGRIPQHFIDQLLSRIDLVDLIDGYVPLKKSGANYKACCPFHDEKSPSFTVSATKQFYHCFGCGENGTAISFLMNYDHLEFREAIEKLAATAGLEIPTEAQSFESAPVNAQGIDLYDLMEQVNKFYQNQLRQHTDRADAVDYLKKRGLSGETAKRFGLGYAPEGWNNLMNELGVTSSSQRALLDTGMLTENEKKRVYDRFRHRIMFPIEDHRGRIVGFGGRVLGKGEPKYLNSPETPIFHKGAELYGLYAARGAIKSADSVLVVEGYMDVIALAQAGIEHSVATLGTATTSMHLQRLFRHTHNIFFSFDGDRAGKAAAWKALQTCLPLMQDGYQVSFLFLPDGEDPDTMVKKIGREAFLELIENAIPLPDFLLNTLQKQADINRLDGRAKLVKLAQPMLQAFPDGVLKKMVSQRIEQLAQLSPSDLLRGKRARQSSLPSKRTDPAKQNPDIKITTVRRAISLLLQYPRFATEFMNLASVSSEQVRGIELIHQLLDICSANPDISTAALLERFRQRSYFNTLCQLAYHHHNDIDELCDEEALELIRGNNQKIIEQFRAAELDDATYELAELTNKAAISNLTEQEQARRLSLSAFLRQQLKN